MKSLLCEFQSQRQISQDHILNVKFLRKRTGVFFFQWADSKVRKYRPVEKKRKSETESSAEKPENPGRKRVLKIDSSCEEES